MSFDAVVVGAGPGGSSAARQLARGGARVLFVERARLPRVKLCAGWITVPTLAAAEIDPSSYPGTLQPFAGVVLFTGRSERPLPTTYDGPASYGIVRSELDHFLARRAVAAGAELREGCALISQRVVDPLGGPSGRSPLFELALSDGTTVRTSMVIGAGGQFCPVARSIGAAQPRENVVLCREIELRVGAAHLRRLTPFYGIPEFQAESDYRGYAWYVTKGDFLNIGIGRLASGQQSDGQDLKRAAERYLAALRARGRLDGIELPRLSGHAYKLWDDAPRRLVAPGTLLVGDAGGFAVNYSAEGIRPAIESGIAAATHALEALSAGDASQEHLTSYAQDVTRRYGRQRRGLVNVAARMVPGSIQNRIFDRLVGNPTIRRRLVVEKLFGFGTGDPS